MPSEGQRANRLPFRSVLFQGNYNIFRQFFQHIKVQKRKNGMRKTHTVFMRLMQGDTLKITHKLFEISA